MSSDKRNARPWGDYALRVLACVLLFGSGYSLLANSTFALRMRDDVPPTIPGLSGVEGLALMLAAVLALIPLAFGRRFLGAFLVSSFLLSGIGAYWWTTIPWDEIVTESDFVTTEAATWWRYALIASPLVAAVLYVTASNASRLRADYRNRGADDDEITRASAASFLAGMGTLVVSLALAGGMWFMLANGLLLDPPELVPQGLPAIVLAAAALTVAWAVGSDRVKRGGGRFLRRPWTAVADRVARARSRARKSPS